ncbi:MAG TPA: histidine kinase N-terminal 7TM domain-containing protein [Anaerolineales bacterium]|nr:histidine kinase N-terminal 7TM domain-containing protein [Anaerolineales bacterium]
MLSPDLLAAILRVLNEIFNAATTITAFALLLYALTFNLRERVARSLAFLLACVTVIHFTDVLAGTAPDDIEAAVWMRLQWVGIAFLPAAYLHFTDALLAATGRPSRGRRSAAVRVSYGLGAVLLLVVTFGASIVGNVARADTVPYLVAGPWFPAFVAFFIACLALAATNLARAYKRCLTRASRRRMRYLMVGAIGPILTAYPVVTSGGSFLLAWPVLFWGVLTMVNLAVAIQLIMMAYAVAYFGVSFPDRVVKSRLFQWILRGPVVASSTLAVTVVVNRFGTLVGLQQSRLVPFAMVGTLLLLQYVITLLRPMIERWFFYGEDRQDISRLHLLEERLLTTGDLQQFLESILNAACDVARTRSSFVAALSEGKLELEVAVGPDDPLRGSEELPPVLVDSRKREYGTLGAVFLWDAYWVLPLRSALTDEMIGLMGLRGRAPEPDFSTEEAAALADLSQRAAIALSERLLQREVFAAVDRLVPQAMAIQRMRAAARFAVPDAFAGAADSLQSEGDLVVLVRDALTHYWGGPRLTRSPLLRLAVVRQSAVENEGSPVNALRAVLHQAVESVRPVGERRFTGEWMLYNILEMKFLQGRKVRDVALRLAMSEADLYRKQRVAIEEVAKAIADMEREAVARSNGGQAD